MSRFLAIVGMGLLAAAGVTGVLAGPGGVLGGSDEPSPTQAAATGGADDPLSVLSNSFDDSDEGDDADDDVDLDDDDADEGDTEEPCEAGEVAVEEIEDDGEVETECEDVDDADVNQGDVDDDTAADDDSDSNDVEDDDADDHDAEDDD